MRHLLSIWFLLLAIVGRAETDSLQILTRSDMPFTSPWALNAETLVNGNWYVRLDPDLGRTQIVASVNLAGDAATYNLWLKCYAKNWATSGNTAVGNPEVRLGTNGWSNAVYGTSWQVTNYTATSAFTNAELRFTQPGPIDGASIYDQYDIRLEGIAITTNLAIGNAYGDAFLDYGLPGFAATNEYVSGNLIYNSSAELGWGLWNMFDRQSPSVSNVFKATFVDQAEYDGDAVTGSKSFKITQDAYARYAFYLSPLELRSGIRQYTLSWDEKTTSTFSTKIVNIADTNSSIAVTATNRGYVFTWPATGTNSWTRRSTNFWLCDLPTPEFEVSFYSIGSGIMLFDNIMLTEGTSTNWVPAQGVEWRMKPRRTAVYSESEPINLQLISANYGGASSNLVLDYTGYNIEGTPIFSGEFSKSVAPGLVTNTISVPRWIPYGSYRILARSTSHPSASECLFSKVLYPDNTNGVIQIHGHPSSDAARTNVALGFSIMRSLSPGGFFRVDEIQVTEGNFTNWSTTDYKFEETLRGGNRIMASMWNNGDNPSWWASPVTAMPTTNRLAAYITALAQRYAGRVWAWESRNEPMNFLSASDQAVVTKIESDIVKTLDPGALYVALGGIDNHTTASNAMVLMDSNTLSRIDAISCHLYPLGQNPVMHMLADNQDRARYEGWRALGAAFGKPVINSESGQWSVGPMRGRQMGYIRGARYVYPSQSFEDTIRCAQNGIQRQVGIGARSIGHGFQHWFLYDGRYSAYRAGNETETTATIFDYSDELRPEAAAILTMKRLVDPPTFAASVTNFGQFVDAYVVAKGGRTFAMLWSNDKTNRTITLSNTNYGVLDIWGNHVQTNQASFRIGRMLRYLVSDSIATNTMVSLLQSAGASLATDTTPPIITVDVFPAGKSNGSNDVWLKFTYVDETWANTPVYKNNITARWRTRPDADWSAWSEEMSVHSRGLRDGPHRLEVQAKDYSGNTGSVYSVAFTVTNGVVVPLNITSTSATAASVVVP